MEYKIVGTARCTFGKEFKPFDMYVIFEGEDKKLYLGYSTEQDGFIDVYGMKSPHYVDRLYYTSFEKIDEGFEYRKLSETNNVTEEIKESYNVGDIAVCAFEYAENKVYISRIDKFIGFIKTIETDNKKLKLYFNEYDEWYSSEMKKRRFLRKIK